MVKREKEEEKGRKNGRWEKKEKEEIEEREGKEKRKMEKKMPTAIFMNSTSSLPQPISFRITPLFTKEGSST